MKSLKKGDVKPICRTLRFIVMNDDIIVTKVSEDIRNKIYYSVWAEVTDRTISTFYLIRERNNFLILQKP